MIYKRSGTSTTCLKPAHLDPGNICTLLLNKVFPIARIVQLVVRYTAVVLHKCIDATLHHDFMRAILSPYIFEHRP